MKIAICAPTDIHSLARFSSQSSEGIAPGLGSTATTPLIIELLRRGHQVTVYTLSCLWEREETYRWPNLTIRVGSCRDRHLARNGYRPEIAYLKRVIQQDNPAFVHAHWTYEFALGALRSGVPTVTTIHDLPWNVLRYYRDPHRAVRLLMSYEVARCGRHFTAVSEDAAAHFRRYFNPFADVRVIHNGLASSFFAAEPQGVETEPDRCTFATVLQGWSRRKNPYVALRAFQRVRLAIPDAQLLMFGFDYEPGGAAQRWAHQQGLEKGVTFVGALPYHQLLQRLRDDVDVIVHPSLDESFSMAALEGMALRKPVIAGKSTPGVREVLNYGKSGMLVDVNDPGAVATAMLRLAQDREYRIRVANTGYEHASSRFRLEASVGKYEELYREFLASTSRDPVAEDVIAEAL